VRVVVLDLFGGQSLGIAEPIGQIVVTIMAACAEIEANAIAERTRSRAQWAKSKNWLRGLNNWSGNSRRNDRSNSKPRKKSPPKQKWTGPWPQAQRNEARPKAIQAGIASGLANSISWWLCRRLLNVHTAEGRSRLGPIARCTIIFKKTRSTASGL